MVIPFVSDLTVNIFPEDSTAENIYDSSHTKKSTKINGEETHRLKQSRTFCNCHASQKALLFGPARDPDTGINTGQLITY